jgi:hypothetical protein
VDANEAIKNALLDIACAGEVGEKHARHIPMRDIQTSIEGAYTLLAPVLHTLLGDDAAKKLLDAYYGE